MSPRGRQGHGNVHTRHILASLKKPSLICSTRYQAGSATYFEAWLIRSLMIPWMRAVNIKRLKVTNGMTTQQFRSMFPDQGEWISIVTARCGIVLAMKTVGYDGPPELFTMWACMFQDRSCHGHTLSSALSRKASRLLKKYVSEHGQVPHPAVLTGLLG